LSSAPNLRRCAFSGTSGSDELAPNGTAILASLTMILLAALLCNYGLGFCLIDVGTEGYEGHGAADDQRLRSVEQELKV
jgi:hypothetical protein